ncbi:MAG: hypothetical protein EZS28_022016, partial [Streblomastix strix]
DNVRVSPNNFIALTQPSEGGQNVSVLLKNSLRDFVIFLNQIIGMRKSITGSTLVGLIQGIQPHLLQFQTDGNKDNLISKAWEFYANNILTEAGDVALTIATTKVGSISWMPLNSLIISGSQTEIDKILAQVNQKFTEGLGNNRADLELYKKVQCEQKRNSIKENAKTKLQQAIDSRVAYLQSEIKERVNQCANEVLQEYIEEVSEEVNEMSYNQLRQFSAKEYAQYNTNATKVRQRCSLRLGWIADKVQQVVNDASYSAQYNSADNVQIGYNKGLNGRILYPHSLDEASGEYGNPVPGTKVILYTQTYQPYQVSVSGDIQTALPGLSARKIFYRWDHDTREQYKVETPKVTYSPGDCTVHVTDKVEGKYYRMTNIYSQEVSVTIPPGWSFGNIVWSGFLRFQGQTVTFSIQDKLKAQVPPIPIRRAN